MYIDEFREYCLAKKEVTEELPFDENTLVFKVAGKIFAITDIDKFESINLKCHPEKAEDLRARYNAVQPGYHMNKKHWNTIVNNSDVTDTLLKQWIDESYELVIQGLTKKIKQELGLFTFVKK
jgi:predicted DNA-binding protein (MmcQ/YjbR family)